MEQSAPRRADTSGDGVLAGRRLDSICGEENCLGDDVQHMLHCSNYLLPLRMGFSMPGRADQGGVWQGGIIDELIPFSWIIVGMVGRRYRRGLCVNGFTSALLCYGGESAGPHASLLDGGIIDLPVSARLCILLETPPSVYAVRYSGLLSGRSTFARVHAVCLDAKRPWGAARSASHSSSVGETARGRAACRSSPRTWPSGRGGKVPALIWPQFE